MTGAEIDTQMPRTSTHRLIAVLAAIAFLVAACSGSDSGAADAQVLGQYDHHGVVSAGHLGGLVRGAVVHHDDLVARR